jgi:sulfur-oxidizing protein SoxY
MSLQTLDRRTFILGAGATALATSLLSGDLIAQVATQPWQQAVKAIVGDSKPVDGRLLLDIPEIAENGNTVPLAVSAESPMTEAEHVKAIHVIATANPQPGVVTFRFTPLSGKAAAASRMRLQRTQDVIALAELSDGKFLMTRRPVRVTVGGCGG